MKRLRRRGAGDLPVPGAGGPTPTAPGTARPTRVQVADRWHLWDNLCRHVERLVAKHHSCLPEPAAPTTNDPDEEAPPDPVVLQRWPDTTLAANTRRRYQQLHDLTGWITGLPGNLDPDDAERLHAIRQRCPELDAAVRHVARARPDDQGSVRRREHADQVDRRGRRRCRPPS